MFENNPQQNQDKIRSVVDNSSTPEEYLNDITTGLNLMTDYNLEVIMKALSNKFVSVVLIELCDESLQLLHNSCNFLLRCFRNGVPFFELPIQGTVIYLDLFATTIGYMLQEDKEQCFYAIDIGMIENDQDLEETDGQKAPQSYQHGFEDIENIKGFKLGHFNIPKSRNLKAVMWSNTEAKIFPFNANPEKSEERVLQVNRKKIVFKNKEDDDVVLDNIDRIMDFGVNQDFVFNYNEEYPEVFTILDTEGNIHVLVGKTFGSIFYVKLTYLKEPDYDTPDDYEVMTQVYEIVALNTSKLVALVKKKPKDSLDSSEKLFLQVFEYDLQEEDGDQSNLVLGCSYGLREIDLNDIQDTLKNEVIIDNLNGEAFISNYKNLRNNENQIMSVLPISSSLHNQSHTVEMTFQIAMNLVANHKLKDKKTKGILYNDFCGADNVLFLLHGKVITVFDLIDNKAAPVHLIHEESKDSDPYNLELFPRAVWMLDKQQKNTNNRWRILVVFNNGEVMELQVSSGNQTVIVPFVTIPGKIIKILRHRNSKNQPPYFIIEKTDGSKVFSTIEFSSGQFREFVFPKVDISKSRFIIMDIKQEDIFWQHIGIISTNIDEKNSIKDQVFIQAKVRIGLAALSPDKEIFILKKEDLHEDIPDVLQAKDIFVDGVYILLIFKNQVVRYCTTNNSFTKTLTQDPFSKILSFDNSAYYWRTILGGSSDQKYTSSIYFDCIDNIERIKSQSSNKDVQLFQGLYPHINKLQFDSISESIIGFTSFFQIRVFPLLHLNRIKLKIDGNKNSDTQIVATKLIQEFLVTACQSNQLQCWNMKTGKYIQIKQEISKKVIDLSKYIFHQRVTDEWTMIRSILPVFKKSDAREIKQENDQTDEQNNIQLFKYMIIEISGNNLQNLSIIIHKKIIGPSIDSQPSRINFGLYASSDIKLFCFYYRNTQDKLILQYLRETSFIYIDEDNEEFSQIKLEYTAEPQFSRLTQHSPDFQKILYNYSTATKEYQIIDSITNDLIYAMPGNLNSYSAETPNFLTDNVVVLRTDDNIMRGFNWKKSQELEAKILNKETIIEKDKQDVNEFMVSHCNFPGASNDILLASMIKVGDFVIGEDCLTYKYSKNDNNEIISEKILLNSCNYFFHSACQDFQKSEDFNEIKTIQCHYKNKIEMLQKGLSGYVFVQKGEPNTGINDPEIGSTQIYITSTYSYYSWRTMDLLGRKLVSLQTFSQNQLRNLSYSQIPGGRTLLHFLNQNGQALEYLFKMVQQEDRQKDDTLFYVPLLTDDNHQTALDLALNCQLSYNPSKEQLQAQIIAVENLSEEEKERKNNLLKRKPTEQLLKHIGTYPFGLFRVNLKYQLKLILEAGIVEFSNFMESCAKTPSFLKEYNRASVEVEETCGAKVFDYTDVWANRVDDFRKEFEDPKAEENLVTMKIIDLPEIHHYTNSFDNYLYKALVKSDNDSIFEKIPIRALIERKWALTKNKIKWWLLAPYIAYLITFFIFTLNHWETGIDVKVGQEASAGELGLYISLKVLIYIFLIYFTAIEVKQARNEGLKEHFVDFWNYLDILPPILIVIAEIIHLSSQEENKDTTDQVIRGLYSWACLTICLRFLYFFRIYRQTNYFIRMIVQVISDMKQFFFIFAVTVISFGHAFYIYAYKIEPEPKEFLNFVTSVTHSYKLALGDFAKDDYDVMLYIIWGISTLFVLIVLLNLLIAIVGETFGTVKDNKSNTMYKDLVELIVENQFLLGVEDFKKLNKGKFLMIIVPEDLEEDQQEIVQGKIDELSEKLFMMQTKATNESIKTEFTHERLIEGIKKIQEDIAQIKAVIQV